MYGVDYNLIAAFFRDASHIQGFIREVLVTLIADVESRNWRDAFNAQNGIPPEHPRSSTSDDVECFFNVLRDMVGKSFTLKQVNTIVTL